MNDPRVMHTSGNPISHNNDGRRRHQPQPITVSRQVTTTGGQVLGICIISDTTGGFLIPGMIESEPDRIADGQ